MAVQQSSLKMSDIVGRVMSVCGCMMTLRWIKQVEDIYFWKDFNHYLHMQIGVTEWNLVCDNQWLVGMASSFYMIGSIC